MRTISRSRGWVKHEVDLLEVGHKNLASLHGGTQQKPRPKPRLAASVQQQEPTQTTQGTMVWDLCDWKSPGCAVGHISRCFVYYVDLLMDAADVWPMMEVALALACYLADTLLVCSALSRHVSWLFIAGLFLMQRRRMERHFVDVNRHLAAIVQQQEQLIQQHDAVARGHAEGPLSRSFKTV